MNTLFTIVLIAVSAAAANGQGFQTGKCLDIPTIADLDFTRYVGKWYEIERFNSWFERKLKCGQAKYAQINETTISVENGGINVDTGAFSEVVGRATVVDPAKPNTLSLKLPIQVGGVTLFENEGNYNVWDTDYENYALIYSCKYIIPNLLKSETSWVLSRTRTLPAETVQYLKGVLGTEGLNLDLFEIVDQTDCE